MLEMRMVYRIARRVRSLFHREQMDRDLHEELRFHIDRQIAENIASGMTFDDARRSALSDLGGIEQVKEACRDMRKMRWFDQASQDCRFGLRAFRKRPAFTPSVITVLAIGVGSATANFSVVNGVLLTALPYRAPERLVRIFGTWEHGSREGISPPDFADFREHNTTFASIAGASIATPLLNLKGAGDPEQVRSRN